MAWVQLERRALASTFADADPERPRCAKAGPCATCSRTWYSASTSPSPVELLLCASGRRSAADVELTGAPEQRDRFRTWAH